MAVYVCVRCGGRYSTDAVQKWGTTAASDGLGPKPRCTHLVPNNSAPKAQKRKGDGTVEYETPVEVCGGDLAFSASGTTVDDEKDADPIKIK